MRALIVLALVSAALLVVGGQYVEARAADEAEDAFRANARSVGDVDAELEGTPLLYHVATGLIPAVTVTATDVESGDPPVRFERVVLDLEQVEVDPFDLLDGSPTTLAVGSGEVSAAIGEEELARVVARDRPDWEVRLADGAIVAEGELRGSAVTVVAEPRITEGDLELVARRVDIGDLPEGAEREVARAFDVRIAIADLPGRVRFTDVRVGRHRLDLTASAAGTVTL